MKTLDAIRTKIMAIESEINDLESRREYAHNTGSIDKKIRQLSKEMEKLEQKFNELKENQSEPQSS